MSVTLEVLKLSGWLNADADCQGRLAVWRRRRRQAACKDIGGTGGAHVEHVRHILDAGGVEAQRLVERPRVLPSRKQGMRCGASCASRKAWKLGRRREAAAGASVARTRRTGDCMEGRRAHGEHGKHVRDAGGVEAQRLVERRRALPSLPRGSKGRLAVRRREAASIAACRGGLDCGDLGQATGRSALGT